MTTPDMKAILEELAAGRIDAAEAARRIDALKASQSTSETTPPEPTNEELAGSKADSDAWAAATDRPEAGYDSTTPRAEAPAEEPLDTKPVNVGGVAFSGKPQWPRFPPTGRMCCVVTAQSLRSRAMASWVPHSTGSAFCEMHRVASMTSALWGSARNSSFVSTQMSSSMSK